MDMDVQVIRDNAAKGFGQALTRTERGMRIGMIRESIASAASSVGLVVSERSCRLVLASEVFGRDITTFNQLSDDELQALSMWAANNITDLATWLSESYGRTLELIW